MHLLDTDHLSLVQRYHSRVMAVVATRASGQLAASIVSVEEQMRGRLAQAHRAKTGVERVQAYRLLQSLVTFYAPIRLLPFDDAAEQQYQLLLRARLRIGTQDLKIAAIALSLGAILVTRNQRDFRQVPGLVIEDWSV